MASKVSRSTGVEAGGEQGYSTSDVHNTILKHQWKGKKIRLPVIRWADEGEDLSNSENKAQELLGRFYQGKVRSAQLASKMYKLGLISNSKMNSDLALSVLEDTVKNTTTLDIKVLDPEKDEDKLFDAILDSENEAPKTKVQRKTSKKVKAETSPSKKIKRVVNVGGVRKRKLKPMGTKKRKLAQYSNEAYTGNGGEAPGQDKGRELELGAEEGKKKRYLLDGDLEDKPEQTTQGKAGIERTHRSEHEGLTAAKRVKNQLANLDLNELQELKARIAQLKVKKAFS